MPYTTNTKMPRIRRDATRLFHRGWGARKIGRYLGYHHTAILKWVKRSRIVGDVPILTKSSRPKNIRKPTTPFVEDLVCKMRIQTKRCAQAIYEQLKRDGVQIAKCTVHRILSRANLLNKRSPYHRYHLPVKRPKALKTGDLVEMDSIHIMIGKKERIYVLTLIDTYSRWTHAKCYVKLGAETASIFLREAVHLSPFPFSMIQTDHGPEFGQWFVRRVKRNHRYTRIGKPNDNAHIERFNRTLQEECLDKVDRDVSKINRALKKYLSYYNNQRIHLGINAMIPREMVLRC
jgi:putative transposase